MSEGNHDNAKSDSPWLDRIVTPLNACSLETFLPVSHYYSPVAKGKGGSGGNEGGKHQPANVPLVIGCYQLNELSLSSSLEELKTGESDDGSDEENGDPGPNAKKSCRSGELRLFMVPHPAESLPSTLQSRETANAPYQPSKFGDPSHVLEMESGVLDGKWRRRFDPKHPTSPLFATACASGRIHIHSLCHSSKSNLWGLSHAASSQEPPSGDGSALCLALAWNDSSCDEVDDRSHENSGDQIVSSYSNGTVALHQVESIESDFNDRKVEILETHRWNAHTMFGCPSEVWTCSYLRGDENVVMSGADDCSLKIWDIRRTQRPTHEIGDTEFEAGVTAISCHPSLSHVFAVGSYDEKVRIYDHRKIDEPLSKVSVGGGVWRIKWHPSCWQVSTNNGDDRDSMGTVCSGKILVAAMHGGCRILDIPALQCYELNTTISDDARVIAEFTAHESMAYGSDWLWFGPSVNDSVASCSFYDRQAFMWNPYPARKII